MAEASMVPIKSDNGKPHRAERFGFLDDFEAELERFWRRPWFGLWRTPMPRSFRELTPAAIKWAPRMDVYEKDNAIVIKTELPGLKKEDVQVEIEGEDLVIRGESNAESEVKEEDYYRSERSFGSFYPYAAPGRGHARADSGESERWRARGTCAQAGRGQVGGQEDRGEVAARGRHRKGEGMSIEDSVRVLAGRVSLQGDLVIPPGARGIVVFAHGSGSSRQSPRNRYVAGVLNQAGLATLLFDLLTPDEERVDEVTAELRFDI